MCLFSEKESTSSGTAGSQEAQQVEVQVQCSPGTENIILTPQAIHPISLTSRVTHEQGKNANLGQLLMQPVLHSKPK